MYIKNLTEANKRYMQSDARSKYEAAGAVKDSDHISKHSKVHENQTDTATATTNKIQTRNSPIQRADVGVGRWLLSQQQQKVHSIVHGIDTVPQHGPLMPCTV